MEESLPNVIMPRSPNDSQGWGVGGVGIRRRMETVYGYPHVSLRIS